MANILVYGTGRLGRRITQLLLHEQFITKIYLYNRTYDKAEGIEIDLKDACPQANISAIKSSKAINSSLDIIIFAASAYPTEERQSNPTNRGREWSYNASMVTAALDQLEPLVDSTNATTLVLTNPVDIITDKLMQRLPREKVFGIAGSLDEARHLAELERMGHIPEYFYLIGKNRAYTFFSDLPERIVSQATDNIYKRLQRLIEIQGFAIEGSANETIKFLRQYFDDSIAETHCSLFISSSEEMVEEKYRGTVICHPVLIGNKEIKARPISISKNQH